MARLGDLGATFWSRRYSHDKWMESIGIPIHKGYFLDDLRTLELGWWEERQCQAAFIQLMGQEGITEARVTEIAPGKTLPPMKFALDETVYVVEGRGLTTVWSGKDRPKKSFEWHTSSLFMIPHNFWHQFSNMQGDRPVRLLQYNYLPLSLSGVRDPDFLFNNPCETPDFVPEGSDLYSSAEVIKDDSSPLGFNWKGNFFPDMKAWDKLDKNMARGAGGRTVEIQFPNSEMSCHMSLFDAGTYKKAHRHGPGRVIVIPAGEGFSIMWEEGKEKVVCPWHEASVLVPPKMWFHQHFNVGAAPARYLALHPPFQFHGHAEQVADRAKDQIEYPDEEPWIRQKFEEELSKKGVKSLMPEGAYKDRDYDWSKAKGK